MIKNLYPPNDVFCDDFYSMIMLLPNHAAFIESKKNGFVRDFKWKLTRKVTRYRPPFRNYKGTRFVISIPLKDTHVVDTELRLVESTNQQKERGMKKTPKPGGLKPKKPGKC